MGRDPSRDGRRGQSIITWWTQENPTFSGAEVKPRGLARLLLRQRLMLLLLLAVLVSIVVWSRGNRVDWTRDEPIRVLLLELIPDGASTTSELMAFNGSPVGEPFPVTAYAVETFFADEFERYHPGTRPELDLEVVGPYVVAIDPPDLADPDASALTLLWRTLAFYRYFDQLADGLGVDFDDFDVRAVAIFRPGFRFEQIEALSLASPRRRFGVVQLHLSNMDPHYSALTLLHELAHTFGASDKYDPGTFYAMWPQGYADPYREPVFPQQCAELMAGDVPITLEGEREIQTIADVRVGMQSAHEMGWVSWWDTLRYYRSLADEPPPAPEGVPSTESLPGMEPPAASGEAASGDVDESAAGPSEWLEQETTPADPGS